MSASTGQVAQSTQQKQKTPAGQSSPAKQEDSKHKQWQNGQPATAQPVMEDNFGTSGYIR